VTNDARVVDRKLIEQPNDSLGVPAYGNVSTGGSVTAPIAEEIDYDNAVTLWHEWDDLGPKMRGRGEPVEEDDRLAGATTAGSVVVEPRTVDVEEHTPHDASRSEDPGDFDSASPLP
jgi:hypothetical protein